MILVDSNIWIDHLLRPDPDLVDLLHEGQVLVHPWVIGEVALGSRDRADVLTFLQELDRSVQASDDEILTGLLQNRWSRRGIGYVDAGLLSSVLLMPGARLATRDRALAAVADELGVLHR